MFWAVSWTYGGVRGQEKALRHGAIKAHVECSNHFPSFGRFGWVSGPFWAKKGCFGGTKCAVLGGHLPTWRPRGVFGSKLGFGKGTSRPRGLLTLPVFRAGVVEPGSPQRWVTSGQTLDAASSTPVSHALRWCGASSVRPGPRLLPWAPLWSRYRGLLWLFAALGTAVRQSERAGGAVGGGWSPGGGGGTIKRGSRFASRFRFCAVW